MNKRKLIKRKLLATLLFSFAATAPLIAHGYFFDLDRNAFARVTIGGFIVTFVLAFIILLTLEKIFDLENHEEFKELEKRVKRLEK